MSQRYFLKLGLAERQDQNSQLTCEIQPFTFLLLSFDAKVVWVKVFAIP